MSVLKVDNITNLTGSRDTALDIGVPLKFVEGAAPSSTDSGYGYLYAKTDGKLYFDSDNISETELTGAGVSLTSANTFTREIIIDGEADAIQLKIQAHSTQDTNTELFLIEDSSGTDLMSFDTDGDLNLKTDNSVIAMGADTGFTISHDGSTGGTIAGTPITINSSGTLTLDSSQDITIDALSGNVYFKDDGTTQLFLDMDGTAGAQIIQLGVDGDDLIFKNYDGSAILTLDDNLTATFASSIACTSIAPSSQAATFDMNGQILDNAKLQSYKETINTVVQDAATVTLDMNNANVFYTVLTQDCTTVQFDNMLAGHSATWIVKNAAAGGSSPFNNDFTGGVNVGGGSNIARFPGGEEPEWTDAVDAVDIFTFFAQDISGNGTVDNIYVMIGGLDFKA